MGKKVVNEINWLVVSLKRAILICQRVLYFRTNKHSIVWIFHVIMLSGGESSTLMLPSFDVEKIENG